jgi:hypothetical protein
VLLKNGTLSCLSLGNAIGVIVMAWPSLLPYYVQCRKILCERAKQNKTITYAEVAKELGLPSPRLLEATYRAAVARWPAARIILRQGARVVQDSVPQIEPGQAAAG